MSSTIIDSHAHLGWDSFAEDRNEVIQRAFAEGVRPIVNAGVDLKGIPELLSLADEFQEIFVGIGLHPHEAKFWTDQSADEIRKAAKHQKVVAIGECGLDYFYNHSERETQLLVFSEQIKLAVELEKPLIIHTRDAWDDTFNLLREHGQGKVRGVFHCFTGGPEVIPTIKELDFYVSFSGIVTFPKAGDLQAAAPLVDSERLMVETDCPYLAPQGKRGKRNEPAFVWIVAEKLAQLRGVSKSEIAELTSRNARRLFSLPD